MTVTGSLSESSMNQPPMNLRGAAKVTRRYKKLVGAVALIGLVAGVGYAVINPPQLSSQALLVIPLPSPNIETQVLIAGSTPVLDGALPALGSESFQSLQSAVKVAEVTPNAISITAKNSSARQAENEANAVTSSYISFITSSKTPIASVEPRILVSASTATGISMSESILIDGVIGLLAGLLIGLVAAAGRDRREGRLWQRDQIARAASAPVLAALAAGGSGGTGWRVRFDRRRPAARSRSARVPGDARAWARFFKDFEPLTGSTWQLRTVLDRLAAVRGIGSAGGTVTVLSVSSDRTALVLGPQLAVFAARAGTRTALVVGPQYPPADTAGLQAVAAAGSQLDRLRIVNANPADDDWSQRDVELSVIVVTVQGSEPAVPAALAAIPTVLAVTAGAVTSQELARVAAAVRQSGSRIAGVIVGNPEASDGTTGLTPGQRRPTVHGSAASLNGRVTEMR